jgi:hypothetical protein
MTIQERIERAQRNAEQAARIAQEADDEARGCEAIGLNERAERCRDRELRHTENAAVYSATARKLREQNTDRPAVSLAAADGTPHAQAQAQAIDAERNEALGLAVAS